MTTLRPARLVLLVFSIVLGGTSWLYAQLPQTAGALTTQDYTDIQQLYGQYNFAFDFGDVETWVQLFTPDGALNSSALWPMNVSRAAFASASCGRDAPSAAWAVGRAMAPAMTAVASRAAPRNQHLSWSIGSSYAAGALTGAL